MHSTLSPPQLPASSAPEPPFVPAPRGLRPLLRVAVALCFIGHGAFGILTKEAWLPYFGLVGIEPALAWQLMPVIGTTDILIGLAVLARPARLLLAYAALWCLWTAALRPLTGEGVWEMLERAGNYGVPLAFLLLGGGTHAAWPSLSSARPCVARLRLVGTTLQWTTVLLLVGHGALLLGGKPVFLDQWQAIGVGAAATPVIGAFELLLAGAVALRPGTGIFVLVGCWKIATEGLWLPIGAPVWEWIERAGSYAAPLGAALLCSSRKPLHRSSSDPWTAASPEPRRERRGLAGRGAASPAGARVAVSRRGESAPRRLP